MLWIALHLPCLSLEAFQATVAPAEAGAPPRPVALIDGARLTAVDAVAAARGLRPGQQRATALALAPDTLLGQADGLRDATLLQAVAHAALAFTPSVAWGAEPGVSHTVLLEVSSTLRVFGGLERLLARLHEATAPLVAQRRVATAPTAAAAALFARWGNSHLPEIGPHTKRLALARQHLDAAPLDLLAAGWQHRDTLQGMGLDTLAQLRALPRDGLARRFGPALLAEIDAARGEAPEAHRWLQLPDAYEARLELFARADSTEQVLHAASVMLARLVAWAGARRARVARFTLDMQHEPRHRHDDNTPASTPLEVALAEPSGDAVHLGVLLRERLARLPLPAPTLELRLRCHDLAFQEAPNGELFATPASRQEGLLRLLERLQARLGRDQVCAVQRRGDHRPERATALPALDPAAAGQRPAGAQLTVGPGPARVPRLQTRPVWLLPQPRPLDDHRGAPWLDGHPLQILAGPQRIETGWWDADLVVRDYFVARAQDDSLVWVFRSRLPGSDAQSPWYLHGRFA